MAYIILVVFCVLLAFWLGGVCKSARRPLFIGLIIKLVLLSAHTFVFRLLPGRGDAVVFVNEARIYSELGSFGALTRFDISSANGFSAIAGALMSALGNNSTVVPELLNVFLGLVCIFATVKLALNCGARTEAAQAAGLIVAVAPSIAQYSVVALREMMIVTPLMLGLVALTKGSTPYRTSAFIVFSTFCVMSSFFHGAMITGILGFGVALFVFQPMVTSGARSHRISGFRLVVSLLVFVGMCAAVGVFVISGEVSKLGKLADGGVIAEVSKITTDAARGGSAYLTDFKVEGYGDLAAGAPLRLFYFLFSPTPWMISSPAHLLGLLDVAIYGWSVWMIWLGYRSGILNERMIVVIGVIATLALVYAFGTSNAGTAIRHRAKLGYGLVAVACAARSMRRQAEARDRAIRYKAYVEGRPVIWHSV